MIEVQVTGISRARRRRPGSIYLGDASTARVCTLFLPPTSLSAPSTCIPSMSSPSLSQDLRRSPTQHRTDSPLSPSVARTSPFHPRRNHPPRHARPHVQTATRDPPAWQPQPSAASPSARHPAIPPPPSQLVTAGRFETAGQSTFPLRDQAVELSLCITIICG